VSVNGWNVVVPQNTLVVFPAAYVPWKDFVAAQESLRGFEISVRIATHLKSETTNRRL
jgi:hypothetical protein